MSEMSSPAGQIRVTSRSKNKRDKPLRKSSIGQNGLSYLEPKIWKALNSNLKSAKNFDSFKHKFLLRRTYSLKTSILRKLIPIYFIKVLKDATERSINNPENAAFLLTFEINYFLFSSNSFLSKTSLEGPLWKQSRTDLLMLSLLC